MNRFAVFTQTVEGDGIDTDCIQNVLSYLPPLSAYQGKLGKAGSPYYNTTF